MAKGIPHKLLMCSIIVAVSCNQPCDFEPKLVHLNDALTGNSIADFENDFCQNTEVVVSTDNTRYIVRPYFDDGSDIIKSFELGNTVVLANSVITPASLQGGNNFFEIIELDSVKGYRNNIGNPKITSVTEDGPNEYTGNVSLDNQSLQLILCLKDIDDKGGAKTWKFEKIVPYSASDSTPDPNEWSCVLDNEYRYMKGSRMRYNPGKGGDERFCEEEIQEMKDAGLWTQARDLNNIYASYLVSEKNTTPIRTKLNQNADPDNLVKAKITLNFGGQRKEDIWIIDYKWNRIIVLLWKENEDKSIQRYKAIMKPTGYAESI